jgi:hypothetical protein
MIKQSDYDALLRKYEYRGRRIQELEDTINKLEENLSSANFKIDTELEPRIKREKQSYDEYVTSGGSDSCFNAGINGKCGVKCPDFGSKDECCIESYLIEYLNDNNIEHREDIKDEDIVTGCWECENSPTGECFYDSKEDPCLDECLICGEPDERK